MNITVKDMYDRVYSVVNRVEYREFLFEMERVSNMINSVVRLHNTELEILSGSSSSVSFGNDLVSIVIKKNLTSTTLTSANTIAQIITAFAGADNNTLIYYNFKSCVLDFDRVYFLKDGVPYFFERRPLNELMMNFQEGSWSNSSGYCENANVSNLRLQQYKNIGGMTYAGDFYFSNNSLILNYDMLMEYSSSSDLPIFKFMGMANKGIEIVPHATAITTNTTFYIPDYSNSLLEVGIIYLLMMRPKYKQDDNMLKYYREQYNMLLANAQSEAIKSISYTDKRKRSVWS